MVCEPCKEACAKAVCEHCRDGRPRLDIYRDEFMRLRPVHEAKGVIAENDGPFLGHEVPRRSGWDAYAFCEAEAIWAL